MKKYNKYLMILAAGMLAACSSMEVDEEEIAQENFPADFSLAEYIELHPGLLSLQIQDSVKNYNAGLTLEKADINADLDKFLADTVALKQIFLDPTLGGFSQDDWDIMWEPTETVKPETTVVKLDTVQVKFENADGITVVYFPSSITIEDNVITGAEGYTDSSKTEALTCDAATCGTFVTKKGGIVADTTKSIDSVTVVTPGAITADKKMVLQKYNFNDIENDYEALKGITPDTTAISQQYIVYGKKAGWAYRKCKESELNNKELLSVSDVKLGTTYCDDDGIVREIK